MFCLKAGENTENTTETLIVLGMDIEVHIQCTI